MKIFSYLFLSLVLVPFLSFTMEYYKLDQFDKYKKHLPKEYSDEKKKENIIYKEYFSKKALSKKYFPKKMPNFTQHALQRMAERNISNDDVSKAVYHGNRYNALNGLKLCVKSRVGVILEEKNNTVITVLDNIGKTKLENWLSKRDATKKLRYKKSKKNLNIAEL
jgi:Domain of unknown function (DUF4258)